MYDVFVEVRGGEKRLQGFDKKKREGHRGSRSKMRVDCFVFFSSPPRLFLPLTRGGTVEYAARD